MMLFLLPTLAPSSPDGVQANTSVAVTTIEMRDKCLYAKVMKIPNDMIEKEI
jgi:hypothetical protein